MGMAGGFAYELDDDDGATITGCSLLVEVIEIPTSLDGHPVRSIAAGAFKHAHRTVEIFCPETLRHIGQDAFQGCALLSRLHLNEGLLDIGDHAFSLCFNLKRLDLPASLRSLGTNLTGASAGLQQGNKLDIRVPAASEHLRLGDDGILYQRLEDGFRLVDASRCQLASPELRADTREVGARAFAGNVRLETVVLPEGVRSIGERAFLCCENLVSIELPATLRAIGDLAFSQTALSSLRLPAACVELAPQALNFGPVVHGQSRVGYESPLRSVAVDRGNPVLRMCGGVLCRERADGSLEALLCPREAHDVFLPDETAEASMLAFAGTDHIGTLSLPASLSYSARSGLLPRCRCERIEVRSEGETFSLDVPAGEPGRALCREAFRDGTVNLESLYAAYDASIASLELGLEKAKLLVARLAAPVFIAPSTREAFAAEVRAALPSICVRFGECAHWAGFDQLVAAGLLDRAAVTRAVGLVSARADAATAGYLLNMQHTAFGKVKWDYEL